MDRRLTAYVLRYLLEHRFESKAEMARQLGMRQRTIEKVFENLDVVKAGTVAFDKAIYYCAENHISLDSILEGFIEELEDGAGMDEMDQQAFNRLRMTKPLTTLYRQRQRAISELEKLYAHQDHDLAAYMLD